METKKLDFARVESNIYVKDLRNMNLKDLAKELIRLRFELDFDTDVDNCMSFDRYDINDLENFRIVEVYVSTTGKKSITVYNHIQNEHKLDMENEENFEEFFTKTIKAVDDELELDQKAREAVKKLNEMKTKKE